MAAAAGGRGDRAIAQGFHPRGSHWPWQRLGFVCEDENKIMSLSVAGLGYLLFVKAAGITGVAEAFAAGYRCAAANYEAKLDKV